jgi:hypothetical protein
MAMESAERQAEQSRDTVQLQQQVAEGTKRLVSAEAESRRQWIAVKRDLELETAEVSRQRDLLETERRAIAAERNRDPILASAIESVGLIFACLIPLIVAWRALHISDKHARDQRADAEVLLSQFLRPELPALGASKPSLRLPGRNLSQN